MDLSPKIFHARVMHNRTGSKKNFFSYAVYYLALPLSRLHSQELASSLSVNRSSYLSFHEKDHGARDGSSLQAWAATILKKSGLRHPIAEICLVTLPRVLGYVFNPVSFWFFLDKQANIRAVLCEVNNTFSETHIYFCMKESARPIASTDWLHAKKIFHVSPFLDRAGEYFFRFSWKKNYLKIFIDYTNKDEKKQLLTSLIGRMQPLTRKNLRMAFLQYPLVTLKIILLIHWQALRLWLMGEPHRTKPQQKKQRLSFALALSKTTKTIKASRKRRKKA